MKKASERIQKNNGIEIVSDRLLQMMKSVQQSENKSNLGESKGIRSETEV